MDYEKLIEQLRSEAATFRPDSFAQTMLLDAAHALSTLQDENKRLKNKLSELAHLPFDEPGIGERTRLMAENAELRAELEQKEKYYEQMVDALAATESAKLEQVKRENETLKHALQNWHEEV
nr:MAG TPA: centrosome microtubule-binding domain protein [Caudoviricetes sp.]